MKSNYIIFTVLFILIGAASFTFGFISCQSVNNAKPQNVKENNDSKENNDNKENKGKNEAPVVSRPRGKAASFLIPEVNSEKGVQRSLGEKSHQIIEVWTAVKSMNGVINVLQSAQVKDNYFIEASVNPLEFLSPIDSVFEKISGLLLGAYSVVVFQKVLLSFSAFFVFLLAIPVCALITIITLWTYKDKSKLIKVVIVSVLISLIIPFAVPFSINTSSLFGNKILAKNIGALTAAIEENGKTANAMENEIVRSRRTGNSIISYMGRVRTLSETMMENALNYYIISLFILIVIPVITLLLIFFLTRYATRLILGKK